MAQTRVILDESEIPTHWYNIAADLKNPPAPPLGPDGQPVTPDKMLAIFPGTILEQEMSAERWIPIPEEVRKIYALWRPSPLCRAERLEQIDSAAAKRHVARPSDIAQHANRARVRHAAGAINLQRFQAEVQRSESCLLQLQYGVGAHKSTCRGGPER